jgi:hypothetical protein
MGTYTQTNTYRIIVNGQQVTVTTTYKATCLDPPAGPGITKHELSIQPCDVVGSAELEAIKNQITDWTRMKTTTGL